MTDRSDDEHMINAIEAHAEVINELIATLTGAKLITQPTAAWLLERVQDGRTEVAALKAGRRAGPDDTGTEPAPASRR
jgi:hypothetical protein